MRFGKTRLPFGPMPWILLAAVTAVGAAEQPQDGPAATPNVDLPLIAHWSFYEVSGNQCADASGHGWHAEMSPPTPLVRRRGLFGNALSLSGGQQQRLCIARAIATNPDVVLMDEPCSALDPIATAKVEELIDELREHYTIAIVTHSMQQAARVSDRTAFMYLGKMIEYGETDQIFTNPAEKRTEDYITGRYG